MILLLAFADAATYRTCAEVLAAGETADIATLDPDGEGAARFTCDQATGGGGWTLVLHVADLAGLQEDDFLALFGHNRFTDVSWRWEPGAGRLQVGLNGGLMKLLTQGAVDISRFDGLWDDVRMTCTTGDTSATETHFVQVDGYATTNGNHKLLGAAQNGVSYAVDPATNSMGLSTVWHDNETETANGWHYLCDQYEATEKGPAPQFGFCYTDFLDDPNESDQGDSIVSLGFGTIQGGDSWSDGFTGECGDMATTAQQNAGTYSVWIR